MRVTILLIASLLFLAAPALANETSLENTERLHLRVVVPSKLGPILQPPKAELKPVIEPTPRRMPDLSSLAPGQNPRRGRLQLPPQSWPFPMVQLNPHPVLPGTAGW